MKKPFYNYILGLIIGTFIIGCKDTSEAKKNQKNNEVKTESKKEQQAIDTLCFRNEHPFQDDPSMKDVEELQLFIENKKVTGTFHWLPAQKDQRKGSLTGTISDNSIEAKYIFEQEGNRDTVNIKIDLETGKAIISGGEPALGLNVSISQIDCETY